MNKEQKRKVQLQQRILNESLTFQTMFGAKQKNPNKRGVAGICKLGYC